LLIFYQREIQSQESLLKGRQENGGQEDHPGTILEMVNYSNWINTL
jgi:hypothetical protein